MTHEYVPLVVVKMSHLGKGRSLRLNRVSRDQPVRASGQLTEDCVLLGRLIGCRLIDWNEVAELARSIPSDFFNGRQDNLDIGSDSRTPA